MLLRWPLLASLIVLLIAAPAPPDSAHDVEDPSDVAGLLPAQPPSADASAGIGAGITRVPRPVVPAGPRRIGLQVGHWLTSDVPSELRRLEVMTGTSGGGVNEWQVNLDVANRVARELRAQGYVVDVLPTTVPAGYLADVFIALHCDGSSDPSARGFKAAHGSRRGPYEDVLVHHIVDEYGRVTGLPRDHRLSSGMLGYYAFNWRRYQSSVAPHTPAAILEMGFLTSPQDRGVLLTRSDLVVEGIVRGITRFLADVPAGVAFAEDLLIPAPRAPSRP